MIPDHLRPWVLSAVALLAAFSIIWQLVKPLGELLHAFGLLVAAVANALKSIFPRPPQPLPDAPEPEAIPDERTIWETKAVSSPVFPIVRSNGGMPILTIANMKGGVGKTTVTANLAAYFQKCFEKRILVIDFDYQGSLSETLWSQADRHGKELRAHSLIGSMSPVQVQAHARPLAKGLDQVDLYPSDYPFATIENNIMIDWVSNRTTDDVRFRLCRILRDPVFQQHYSMVLIDCPPRITTGTINALCASTHLLIPTKLDEMSAEAAIYFMQQIERMQDGLYPRLQLIGVAPTMTQEIERLSDFEERGKERLENYGKIKLGRSDLLMMEHRIPQKVDIARSAGVGVAYVRRVSVRPIFDGLGSEILQRL
jgi:chromosome partitioning protein